MFFRAICTEGSLLKSNATCSTTAELLAEALAPHIPHTPSILHACFPPLIASSLYPGQTLPLKLRKLLGRKDLPPSPHPLLLQFIDVSKDMLTNGLNLPRCIPQSGAFHPMEVRKRSKLIHRQHIITTSEHATDSDVFQFQGPTMNILS